MRSWLHIVGKPPRLDSVKRKEGSPDAFRYHDWTIFPGDSLLHRLDPRTKIILLFFFLVAIFA